MRKPSQALIDLTKAEGLCGAVDPQDGYICTRKIKHPDKHKAVLLTVDSDKDVVLDSWD